MFQMRTEFGSVLKLLSKVAQTNIARYANSIINDYFVSLMQMSYRNVAEARTINDILTKGGVINL